MKKLGFIILSFALIFAMTGCKEEPGTPPGGEDGGPVINGITFLRDGEITPTPIVRDGTIDLDYDETITLTADVSDGDTYSWNAETEHVVHIFNETALSTTIQGIIIAGGDTEVTFTATNGLSNTFKFKIQVAPRPSEGLFLDVYHGSVSPDHRIIEDQLFEIYTDDSVGLTFSADAVEDGIDISGNVTWEAHPLGVVTLSAGTGSSITITSGEETGLVIITATAPSSKPDVDDKVVTFRIQVDIDMENVLYMWNAEKNAIDTLTGSGQSWSHPGYLSFKEQKDGMRVRNLRSYGAGVNETGAVRINNSARLAIGQSSNTATASGNTYATNLGGEIDLYRKKVRLTLNYKDLAIPNNDRQALRVFVNQNTTGQANSMFGNGDPAPCSLKNYSYDDIIDDIDGNNADSGKIVLEIDTTSGSSLIGGTLFGHANEAGLAKAFICLLNQDETVGGGITITGIKLEYIDGIVTPDTLSLTVKEGETEITGAIRLALVGGTTATLTAVAAPAADSYSWGIADTSIATINTNSGDTVIVTAAAEGNTTITVQAAKTGYFSIVRTYNIIVDAEAHADPMLVVYNQNTGALNAATTPNGNPPALTNGRIVITNFEGTGNVQSTGLTANTFLYLDTPFTFAQADTISARVLVTEQRGNLTDGDNNRGALVGIFTDPTVTSPTASNLRFMALRSAWNGMKRIYYSQSDIVYNATQTNGANFELADTAAAKTDGFREQEYIYKVERTSATAMRFSIWSSDGLTELASGTRNDSNSSSVMQSADTAYYFGFFVCAVRAEISDIVISKGDIPVFAAATGATPKPVSVRDIRITTAQHNPAGGADYTGTFTSVEEHGHNLNAVIIPSSADQLISWSVSGTDNTAGASVSSPTGTSTTVRFTSDGTATIIAESTVDPGKTVGYKYELFGEASVLESITIAPAFNKTTFFAGNNSGIAAETIQLSITAHTSPAAPVPVNLNWVVKSANNFEDETPVTDLSISSSGLLSITGDIAATKTVWVFVQCDDTKIVSNSVEITVRPFGAMIFSWDASQHSTAPYTSASNWRGVPVFTHNGTITSNNTGLIIPTSGRLVLGLTSGGNTSNTVTHAGALDFSKTFKITYFYTNGSGAGNFNVYMNNISTGSTGNSVIRWHVSNAQPGAGGTSNLSPIGLTSPAAGSATMTINPATNLALSNEALGLATPLVKETVISQAFLLFRGDTSGGLTITNLIIEYVEDPK